MDLFWLPGLDPAGLARREWPGPGSGLWQAELTPEHLAEQATRLRAARREAGLGRRPVREVIAVLDAVARRWLDPAYPLRRAALAQIPRCTGYAPAMVAEGLDLMVRRAAGPALAQLLQAELGGSGGPGSPAALDGWVRHPGGRGLTRARGPELAGFVMSGNVPGIPAFHLAVGLLAGSACLAKTAAGEPVFAPLWCRSLAEVDPALGACAAAAYWPGAAPDLHRAAFATAGAVVAFGSDAALAQLGAALPAGCRFAAHGSRLSVACVHAAALAPPARQPRLAAALARDVAMFDQQGCVSPQVVFVSGGAAAAEALGGALAGALAGLESRWPRAPLPPGSAAAIQVARSEYQFRPGSRVWASPGSTAWTVALAPPGPATASPLNRFVLVHPVATLAEVPVHLSPWAGYLQTCVYAGPPAGGAALAEALAELGLSRLCRPGRAQEPPPAWHHDGRGALNAMLTFTDIEW